MIWKNVIYNKIYLSRFLDFSWGAVDIGEVGGPTFIKKIVLTKSQHHCNQ